MKFIETFYGVLVNFDAIAYFDNDFDEDKEYSISSIVLKNGHKLPFMAEIDEFNIPDNEETFCMQDNEMSILHQCFLSYYFLWNSCEIVTFEKAFNECWKDFERRYSKLLQG
jgi:hypothetical protein